MMRISALIIFLTWRSQNNEVAMLNIYSFKQALTAIAGM